MKKTVFVLLLLGAISGAPAEELPKELTFGIISTESTTNLRKGFEPFLERLQEKSGFTIRAFFATDYTGVIEAMRFNKVQLAWLGNSSALEAVNRAGGEIFVQTTGADGEMGYQSVIIVHRDSPYQDLDSLLADGPNLTFGNGDPNSTSGYLIPNYYIWSQRAIDPVRYFKRMRNANHEVNCLSVAMKQVDCATNNTESLRRFQKVRPDLFQNLRVIWTSPTIAQDPLVWRYDLPREVKARLKAAFLSFGRGENATEELELLANLSGGWGTFLDSDNQQLLPYRILALEKDITELRNREGLKTGEKGTRLSELEAEMNRLQMYMNLMDHFEKSSHAKL